MQNTEKKEKKSPKGQDEESIAMDFVAEMDRTTFNRCQKKNNLSPIYESKLPDKLLQEVNTMMLLELDDALPFEYRVDTLAETINFILLRLNFEKVEEIRKLCINVLEQLVELSRFFQWQAMFGARASKF